MITEEAVRSVRPGYGLAPKYASCVIGLKVVKGVSKNNPVIKDVLG
ncbi:hypothetical protein [Halomonas sp. E19]